jgi:hypothetical protein
MCQKSNKEAKCTGLMSPGFMFLSHPVVITTKKPCRSSLDNLETPGNLGRSRFPQEQLSYSYGQSRHTWVEEIVLHCWMSKGNKIHMFWMFTVFTYQIIKQAQYFIEVH